MVSQRVADMFSQNTDGTLKRDLPHIPLTALLKTPGKVLRAFRQSSYLPANTPVEFLSRARPEGTVVACLGDSITHGNVSYNWVATLNERLNPSDQHFINAGINGHVAWQLLQRLQPVLDCKPDVAIVLVGTNDAMGSFHKGDGKSYKSSGKLPYIPTRENYRLELRKILRALHPIAKVGVCTLPPLGEYPDSAINQHVQAFNCDIRQIVAEENKTLLPLDEKLTHVLNNRANKPWRDYTPGPLNRLWPILRATADYYINDLQWDASGAREGLALLPDHIHLGETGGLILAELVEAFLQDE